MTQSLHDLAMTLCDVADAIAKRAPAGTDFTELTRTLLAAAAVIETRAATETTEQPSRAILMRSAATCALQAREPEWARSIVAAALGDPTTPEPLRSELRELADRARAGLGE